MQVSKRDMWDFSVWEIAVNIIIYYPYLLNSINSTYIVWLGQVPFQVCTQLLQKVGNLAVSECELQNEMFGDLEELFYVWSWAQE